MKMWSWDEINAEVVEYFRVILLRLFFEIVLYSKFSFNKGDSQFQGNPQLSKEPLIDSIDYRFSFSDTMNAFYQRTVYPQHGNDQKNQQSGIIPLLKSNPEIISISMRLMLDIFILGLNQHI